MPTPSTTAFFTASLSKGWRHSGTCSFSGRCSDASTSRRKLAFPARHTQINIYASGGVEGGRERCCPSCQGDGTLWGGPCYEGKLEGGTWGDQKLLVAAGLEVQGPQRGSGFGVELGFGSWRGSPASLEPACRNCQKKPFPCHDTQAHITQAHSCMCHATCRKASSLSGAFVCVHVHTRAHACICTCGSRSTVRLGGDSPSGASVCGPLAGLIP